MLMDWVAMEEQSHAGAWLRVASATCTGLKTALGKSGEPWGHSFQPDTASKAQYEARGETPTCVIQMSQDLKLARESQKEQE